MGKLSRTKGHSFERDVANAFVDAGFKDAKRNLTETQTGGQGIDLVGTDQYDIQCKRYKTYVPITKIEEIPIVKDRIPVLVTKGDRATAMAVLPFKDFLDLIKK